MPTGSLLLQVNLLCAISVEKILNFSAWKTSIPLETVVQRRLYSPSLDFLDCSSFGHWKDGEIVQENKVRDLNKMKIDNVKRNRKLFLRNNFTLF